MKRSLFAAALFSILALTACTAPTPPSATGVPSSPEQPTQTAQVEGDYILDLQKPSGANLRLWIFAKQNGTTLTGRGYAGYVHPGSQWIEPYGGEVTGEVSGKQVKFNLRIHDFYDTNEEVRYEFVGVMGEKFSGTWKRVFITGYQAEDTGKFEAMIWK